MWRLTPREVEGELWGVYRLPAVTIPTDRPLRRVSMGERLSATAEQKWDAVVDRIRELHAQGRPILVGTRSVAAFEALSVRSTNENIKHVVLNAKQDRQEASVVALASEQGRVTIATNMAGRGTDIKLTRSVAQAGGLHVLATERHESRRFDRQIYGRAGRQGDSGSYEMMTSLDDELPTLSNGSLTAWLARALLTSGKPLEGWPACMLLRHAQRTVERLHARMRRDLSRYEDQIGSALAFTGRVE